MKQSGSHNQHARLAPSGAKTWVNCTASPAFAEANSHRVPEDTGSVYAEEGTAAHDWATEVLLDKIAVEDVPEDFRPHVLSYVEFCKGLIPEGEKYLVEHQVPLFFQPDHSGTLDFGYASQDLVVISDLKYGQGVLVECEHNFQLSIYALSLIRLFEGVVDFTPDTKVVMAIHQPRHHEAANQLPWETTLSELEDFCKDIDYRATQINAGLDRVKNKLPCGERDISGDEVLEAAPMLRFSPSEGSCRWCKCRAFCDARLAALDENAPGDASMHDFLSLLPDLSKEEKKASVEDRLDTVTARAGLAAPLTDDQLVSLYRARKTIETFLGDVVEYLEALALDGRPVEGTKLVAGRAGNRAWADEDAADTFLRNQKVSADDRYKKKLISPTEAEKLLKDKMKKVKRTATRFESLVTRSEGKPVLALGEDKRPAIDAAVDLLKDADDGEEFEV